MAEEGPSTPAVEETRRKVEEYLANAFDDVTVDDDKWCITYGSAKVQIDVGIFDEDGSVVHVESPTVTGADASPELFHYLATNSHHHEFGHLGALETGDGKATITFGHSLLGEFLDPAELRTAVIAVAFTADQLDNELAARFGGEVHDADGDFDV